MNDLNIKLDEGAIKSLVAEGIMAQLTTEVKEDILKQAVAWVLKEQEQTGYGFRGQSLPSPLQQAFNNAARSVIDEIVKEYIFDNEEFRQAIRYATGDALAHASRDNYDMRVLISKSIAEAIIKSWQDDD